MSLTYDEAKKELSEYRDNIRYIEEKQSDALELKARLEATTKRISAMPNGKGKKEDYIIESSIDRMDAIAIECDKKLQELLIKKFVVEDKIDKLPQPQKSVLYMRFIRGIKLEKIDIGYETRQLYRLQKEGINLYANL